MSTIPSLDMPKRAVSSGLAIAAIVCGVLGFCVPGLGLVAIILGAVALIKASSSPETHGGKGMAIGGIIVGVLTLLFWLFAIGILVPGFAKARQNARDLVSTIQLQAVGQALQSYAAANKGWYPESTADWPARLAQHGVDAQILKSPNAPKGATDSFIYISGLQSTGSAQRILAYENPKYVRENGKVAVLYLDGRVDSMSAADFTRLLESAGRMPAGSNGKDGDKPADSSSKP